jgi:hypothetical protein
MPSLLHNYNNRQPKAFKANQGEEKSHKMEVKEK